MKIVNESADRSQNTLRISFDAKAAVNIGEFSRLGKSRCKVKALDHDFNISTKVTPFGILLPKQDEMYLYLCKSKVTADCMMDCMEDFWINNQINFPDVEKLVINLVSPQKRGGSKTNFRRNHYITFAGMGKAHASKGNIVISPLRLWGLPRIIEVIP